MAKWMFILYFSCCKLMMANAQNNQLTASFIDEQFRFAAEQYKILSRNLPDGKFPRSYDARTGQLITSNSGWWCSGFYPGTLLYLYEYLENDRLSKNDTVNKNDTLKKNNALLENDTLRKNAERLLQLLEPEQFNTRTHDLGFMMYCSFGKAYQLWHKEKDKHILMNAARSLATRFNKKAGVIRSWDHGDWKFPVIIDNMMNLELLTRATRISGDSSFYRIAVSHANTTMQHHFRKDYSSYHVIDYDTVTGNVLRKQTAQGANDSSAWARGQAWALYGYTMMFRETGIKKYLEHARHVAKYMLNHPNRTSDDIPYWDYDAPGIPNTFRDASAAAVIASALLELSQFVDGDEKRQYIHTSENIIAVLGSPSYRAALGTNGGFILKHSVGHLPANSEIDVPLTYADYYFVEALARYKEFILNKHTYTDWSHYSAVFGHEKYYRLYLPAGYYAGNEKYPVIYFFHGWGGRYFKDDNALLNYEKIQAVVDDQKIIMVMWDGNIDTAEPRPYNIGNHADVKYTVQMKDYFKELLTHIDSCYRTLNDRQHRGIIGFSMGGLMSYFIAGTYPDKIHAAVSIAGSPEFFIGYPQHHTLYPLRYLFNNLRDVHLRLHNGRSDILYYLNEEVRSGASWAGVPLDYYVFNGGHRIDTLGETKVFASAVKFITSSFAKESWRAARWSHDDIYNDFMVRNYAVQSNKKTPGFISLRNVDKTGFGLYAHQWMPSGPPLHLDSVTVLTDSLYEPGKEYNIIQFYPRTGKLKKIIEKVDKKGKLTFSFNNTSVETGIYKNGDQPSFVVTGYSIKGNQKYLHSHDSVNISFEIFNRGGIMRKNKKIECMLTSTDSSINILKNKIVMEAMVDQRVFSTKYFTIVIKKSAPRDAEPPQIKFDLSMAVLSSYSTGDPGSYGVEASAHAPSNEIIVPVLYEAPVFDSIMIDDHLSDNNHLAESGEQLMISSGNHWLRLYTEDKYVLAEKEILADEMLPARWPDGYTMSSVITISPECPPGHVIEFYGSYETKIFDPIKRTTTWGKLKIRVN